MKYEQFAVTEQSDYPSRNAQNLATGLRNCSVTPPRCVSKKSSHSDHLAVAREKEATNVLRFLSLFIDGGREAPDSVSTSSASNTLPRGQETCSTSRSLTKVHSESENVTLFPLSEFPPPTRSIDRSVSRSIDFRKQISPVRPRPKAKAAFVSPRKDARASRFGITFFFLFCLRQPLFGFVTKSRRSL
ncbi:hypothetical protein CDAR_75841 [Caerostris darwini]|uniref:Uncharacterized protein n=1 Tax=Caerostris darwini TaxID=1538125 RepID=A0AAV4W3R4_9ARAC|nr:hypothetical protein CDAR_75841 [Caerostris darwini]